MSKRFFIDHETIHDRVTGRHVTTDLNFGPQGPEQLWELLVSLETEIETQRNALIEIRKRCPDGPCGQLAPRNSEAPEATTTSEGE
jgi:hypothetical protein